MDSTSCMGLGKALGNTLGFAAAQAPLDKVIIDRLFAKPKNVIHAYHNPMSFEKNLCLGSGPATTATLRWKQYKQC